MSGAREQVSRLLALAPYLQVRTDVSLSQVAADFGVTPEQIRKDLGVLWMCGLPGLTPDKMIDVDFEAIEEDPEGVVRIDNADFLARPVRLGQLGGLGPDRGTAGPARGQHRRPPTR